MVWLGVLACLAVGLSSPDRAAAQGVERIAGVEISGNLRVDSDLIRQTLALEVGDTYQVDKVRTGIRSLWRQRLFRDMHVATHPGLVAPRSYETIGRVMLDQPVRLFGF